MERTKPLFAAGERAFVAAVSRLGLANPFLADGAEAEREALGAEGHDFGSVWARRAAGAAPSDNARRIVARVEPLLGLLRQRLAAGAVATAADREIYLGASFFLLYEHLDGGYPAFAREHERLFGPPPWPLLPPSAAHLYACSSQVRRAVRLVASTLLGGSRPAMALRVAIWQSIFTDAMARYIRVMYARMAGISTLITGPTGTGKEVAARVIGLSRYVAFDPARQCLVESPDAGFHAVNLSALSPTLVESELFGHQRGAFTGALAVKRGWLELGGSLFLDEIGELALAIQVKLLRVIQERKFQRVGDTEDQPLTGKIIAATNRELGAMIRDETFRLDLYFRICADRIRTPSLREQLDDAPEERRTLVRHIAEREVGAAEADALTDEIEAWMDAHIPADYPWAGNVRELEQCVRNLLVRHSYRPIAIPPAPKPSSPPSSRDPQRAAAAQLAEDLAEGNLHVEELFDVYATITQARTGNYSETARLLGIDRRTAAARVNHGMLARLLRRRGGSGGH